MIGRSADRTANLWKVGKTVAPTADLFLVGNDRIRKPFGKPGYGGRGQWLDFTLGRRVERRQDGLHQLQNNTKIGVKIALPVSQDIDRQQSALPIDVEQVKRAGI